MNKQHKGLPNRLQVEYINHEHQGNDLDSGEMRSVLFVVLKERRLSHLSKLEYTV